MGWAELAEGQQVCLDAWHLGQGLLVPEQPCCPGHRIGLWIQAVAGSALPAGPVALRGRLGRDQNGWVLLEWEKIWSGLGRRKMLAAPLLCLAAAAPADGRAMLAGATTVDVHSHAGRVARVGENSPFAPLAAPMRKGGLAAVCLAIVSDTPTHRVMEDHRIHPFRDPAPGELYAYAQLAFARLHALAAAQSLRIIVDVASLRAAGGDRPGVIVAAEGADFLDGDPDRIDEAYTRWQLRHLQLTHYRVNALGDIQTEPPVHGGLTDAGAAVIRRCNKLGVVVDVAHGTIELVRRAARVTSRPLVLSHTSLTTRPRPFTRMITAEHAKLVAETGGVIGIWPPASVFPDLAALAGGIARMAAVVGVDHVGLGTDSLGLVGPSCFGSYAELPALAEALAAAGFAAAEVRKILGENYARVFAASL